MISILSLFTIGSTVKSECIDFPFETSLLSLFKPWVVIEKHIFFPEYTTGRKEWNKQQFKDCTFRNSRIQDSRC